LHLQGNINGGVQVAGAQKAKQQNDETFVQQAEDTGNSNNFHYKKGINSF
jgi:hypothetical protein